MINLHCTPDPSYFQISEVIMRSQPTAPPPPPPMPNWLSVRCRSAVCPPNPHRSTPGCQGCENVHCKSRPSTDPCANPFCSALKSQFCGGAGDINTWLNTEVVNTFWSFKLGQGGFGAVYKCLNLCTGREVAVKITPGNTVYAQRESALWQAMSSNHQNLVKLYDVHDVGRYKYFIMEYCPDGDLNNFMTPRQVDLRSVLGYVHGIAKGLLYLHQHQLLHRDIKPENILVKNFGNGNYIMKLSDFGLMRFVSCSDNIFSNVPSQTVALAVTMGVGTPLWWAPEVTSGNTYSLAADIWPFGLVILAMLTHQAGQPLLPGTWIFGIL